jgi:predicted nucleic acid-binding protein
MKRLRRTLIVTPSVVVDTGPLIAALDADETHHEWTRTQLESLRPPLLTCEAVLTEATFLLARVGADPGMIVHLITAGLLTIVPLFDENAEAITRLLRRYANVPMSLADACLVRIVERTPHASVFTLDSDFQIYRQKGRRRIPLIAP